MIVSNQQHNQLQGCTTAQVTEVYKMTLARTKDSSSRCSKHTMPPNNRLLVCNTPFKLDKGLLAKKSATIASLLENNPFEDLSVFFNEIPSEPEALELIARFCHGLHVEMTSDNIISLICLSNHLKMTETHCPNNLLNNAILFLKQKILPSWDQTIRSLRASQGPTFQQAVEIGLLDFCIDTLTAHVLSDPNILAHPTMIEYTNDSNNNRPISNNNSNVTRRKLFSEGDHSTASSDSDTSTEDITSLPVKMYKPIVEAMVQRQVPQENIAGSLFRYLKKHADDSEAIEVIERLLPTCTTSNKYPLYPYTLLFEMHELATSLKASSECVASLEIRIGKELYRATPEDLLALDLDIESLKRVLKGFYENFTDPDSSSLVAVAELMEEYLLEVAKKRNMDAKSFAEVAEMASSTSNVGTYRYSDGIYRAVDAYLDKHTELSELEREEVCRVLDFQKMSSQACNHAALNRRLPLRVVVQVLFVSQLQLRDNISKAVGGCCSNSTSNVEEGSRRRISEEIKQVEDEEWDDNDDDEERQEIKERCVGERNCCVKKGKKKVGFWKGMKRKLGCMGSSDYETMFDCNCQTTKSNKKKKRN